MIPLSKWVRWKWSFCHHCSSRWNLPQELNIWNIPLCNGCQSYQFTHSTFTNRFEKFWLSLAEIATKVKKSPFLYHMITTLVLMLASATFPRWDPFHFTLTECHNSPERRCHEESEFLSYYFSEYFIFSHVISRNGMGPMVWSTITALLGTCIHERNKYNPKGR